MNPDFGKVVKKDPFVTAQIESTMDQLAGAKIRLTQAISDCAPGTKLLEFVGQIVFLEGRLAALVTV